MRILNPRVYLEKAKPAPKVVFTNEARDKVRALVNVYDKEIAWHGLVNWNPVDREMVIWDILVYPQKTTATTVDADEAEYPLWYSKLTDEQFNSIRMQGHSHVNMGVTPSGVDEAYYKELVSQYKDYYLVMILNKRDEHMFRFYDIDENVIYDNLEVVNLEKNSAEKWAEQQISEHISVTPVYNYGRYGVINNSKPKYKSYTPKPVKEPQKTYVNDMDIIEDQMDGEGWTEEERETYWEAYFNGYK